jgi:hypothetical protein
MTFAISSGVRIRFGIFGCDVVRKTRRAVAVMPRVLATSRNAGPITTSLAFCCLVSTTWQALHASRAKACPATASPSCACVLTGIRARIAGASRRMINDMICLLGNCATQVKTGRELICDATT